MRVLISLLNELCLLPRFGQLALQLGDPVIPFGSRHRRSNVFDALLLEQYEIELLIETLKRDDLES